MSKKTILIFLSGALFCAVIFGVFSLASRKAASRSAAVSLAPAAIPAVEQPKTSAVVPATPMAPAPAPAVTNGPTSIETPLFTAFLSPQADAHSVIYQVLPGDNLTKISRKYHVTVDLLKRVNHIGDTLRPGMKLKVPTAKLSLVVDKSQNTLILKADEDVLKTYVCSTGVNNSTPVGVFKITDKLVNPTWFKAGAVVPSGSAANVLGTRWMGISQKGYGIHGTTEPEKLGQQVTAGCVRMKNDEVEELYSLVPPGTEVTIVD